MGSLALGVYRARSRRDRPTDQWRAIRSSAGLRFVGADTMVLTESIPQPAKDRPCRLGVALIELGAAPHPIILRLHPVPPCLARGVEFDALQVGVLLGVGVFLDLRCGAILTRERNVLPGKTCTLCPDELAHAAPEIVLGLASAS